MKKSTFVIFIYKHFLSRIGFFFIKIISITYKIKINKNQFFDNNGPFIYASWHQRFFPAITFFSKKKPITAIISKSKDGELISNIVDMLGWHPVRGSSSKDGHDAMKKVISLIREGYNLGHAVDGPQGPFGIVKPGIIKIAQLSKVRIVPVIISFSKYWIFNSWDKFMIPKPFSEITICFAGSYKIPLHMNKNDFEKNRLFIEKKMFELYKDIDS